MVQDWLKSPEYEDDQDRYSKIRINSRNSGQWLKGDAKLKSWTDPNSTCPILWIRGTPGADDQRDDFRAISRALLKQIVEQKQDLLPYLYEECSNGGQPVLQSEKELRSLLKIVCSSLYEAVLILDDANQIQGNTTRALFASRDEGDIRKMLSQAIARTISMEDNIGDIGDFVAKEVSGIVEKFELSKSDGDNLRIMISERAQVGKSAFHPVLSLTGSSIRFLTHFSHFVIQEDNYKLAKTCLAYLTFDRFDSRNVKDEIRQYVRQGWFGFQDYALQNWMKHVEKVDSTILEHDEAALSELSRLLKKLFEMHWNASPRPFTKSKTKNEPFEFFRASEVHDRLVQVATYESASHSSSGAIETDPIDFTLHTERSRALIEEYEQSCQDQRSKTEFATRYGFRPYKCAKRQCFYFHECFKDAATRDRHQIKHDRPFRCPYGSCDLTQIGVATAKDLKQHLWTFHGDSNEGVVDDTQHELAQKLESFQTTSQGDVAESKKPLQKSAKKIATIGKKSTVLHVAASKGRNQALTFLLKQGAHVDVEDKGGYTPLAVATVNRQVNACSVLLQYGANPNHIQRNGKMVHHLATEKEFEDVLEALLASGANLHATDSEGNMALHIAAGRGFKDIINTLLASGADRQAMNLEGKTALQVAAEKGLHNICQTLQASTAVPHLSESKTNLLQTKAGEGKLGNIPEAMLARGVDLPFTEDGRETPPRAFSEGPSKEVLETPPARGTESQPNDLLYINTTNVDCSSVQDSSLTPASIFSLASRASSSLQTQYFEEKLISAAEQLIELLIKDEVLNLLYLVAFESKTIGAERFVRNYRRLLKLFSEELKAEAHKSLEKSAVWFIRSRAGHISNKIRSKYDPAYNEMAKNMRNLEFQASGPTKQNQLDRFLHKEQKDISHQQRQSIEPEDLNNNPPPHRRFQPAGQGMEPDENDYDLGDRDSEPEEDYPRQDDSHKLVDAHNFTHIISFLVSSNAFQNLRKNFKQFVQPPLKTDTVLVPADQTQDRPPTILASLRTKLKLMSAWGRSCEPKFGSGKILVRWKCQCGSSLWDDYEELRPGAAEDLRKSLDAYGRRNVGGVQTCAGTTQVTNTAQNSPQVDSQGGGSGSSAGVSGTSWSHSLRAIQNGLTAVGNNVAPGLLPTDEGLLKPDQKFLLLCVSKRNDTLRLSQPNVEHITDDIRLFRMLQAFERHPRKRVVILPTEGSDILPCRTNPDACHKDHSTPRCDKAYDTHPTPPDLKPYIGPNGLTHLLNHPHEAAEEGNNLPVQNVWLKRFPKKEKTKLAVCPPYQYGLGWGIEFEEGWYMNWLVKFAIIAFVITAITFLVCWWNFRGDVQGATGMAALLVSCAVLLISIFSVVVMA
ncbi:hypothetical protein OEA41_000659 [Lepraria neglecta]|uniref:Uncharacterized protein n=1 Tax=Lepraria neglecta TaxID=209136 RepID=A0AAD9ZJ73_9LECA|nr:hypothetical protein OEA41_000659 [Lepraria neglecta]